MNQPSVVAYFSFPSCYDYFFLSTTFYLLPLSSHIFSYLSSPIFTILYFQFEDIPWEGECLPHLTTLNLSHNLLHSLSILDNVRIPKLKVLVIYGNGKLKWSREQLLHLCQYEQIRMMQNLFIIPNGTCPMGHDDIIT